jgi:KDO2-lipid IV(A) lauroyltransferase
VLLPVTRRLPRPLGLWMFARIGLLVYLLNPTDRRRTLAHLQLIFGEQYHERRIPAMAHAVYRHLGRNLFDALYLSRNPDRFCERFVTADDCSELEEAYRQGKGLICITGHTGCFEMQLHYMAYRGFQSFAVGQKVYDPRLDRYVTALRSGPKITYMHRNGSSREILRLLKAGQIFGVLVDQDTSLEGEFVPFLGRPAHTPSAPMRIAMRFKVPVFVVTTARRPDNTHHVAVKGPLVLADTGDFEQDLKTNLALVNEILSAAILANPEQWVWMHRRWRQQPVDS